MTDSCFSDSCQEQKSTRPSSGISIKSINTVNTLLSSTNNCPVKKNTDCSPSRKIVDTGFSDSCQKQKPTEPSSGFSVKTNNTANSLNSRNNGSVKKTLMKPKPNCFKENQTKKAPTKKIFNSKQKKEFKDKTRIETNSYGTSENICESSYIDSDTLVNDNCSLENNRIDSINEFDENVKNWLTNLESMLTNVKETQENENCTILKTLSKLENKMEENECHIKNLKCNLEKLISNVPVGNLKKPNQLNTKEVKKDCPQKQTTNINDNKNNLDHRIRSIADENICNQKQCVCNLLGSVNKSNHYNDSSPNYTKKVDTDKIPICESMKTKQESIMFPVLPKPIVPLAESISCLKSTSSQDSSSCSEIASLQEHAIEHAKKLNGQCETKNTQLKINSVSTQVSKINTCSVQMSSMELKNDSNYISKSLKLDCDDGICEFLRSQPIPEWIKKMRCREKGVPSKPCQLCRCEKNSPELQKNPSCFYKNSPELQKNTTCLNKNNQLYNIERVVHNNSCYSDTVYQITSKDRIKRPN